MKTCVAILTLVCCAFVPGLSANAQSGAQPVPTQLHLVIRTDRESYRLSDTLRLETHLVNTGHDDVFVWNWDLCWNPARGLSLHLIASDGSLAKGKVLLDCVPPPPIKGDSFQFVRLEPMTFHGRIDKFRISDFIEKPGEYEVEVTFKSFLSPKWIDEFYGDEPIAKLPLWTMTQPSLKSTRIHVRISP